MPRIAGVNLADNKKIIYSLTQIYGLGLSLAQKILKEAKVDHEKRFNQISPQEIEKIRKIIEENYKVEGELKMQVSQNIKRLKEIGSYRGSRHIHNLPLRGQRTKTNARTKRGKKVTVGSGRKRAAEKT